MLDIDTLSDAIGSLECTVRGETVTIHYRQATHPEIVQIRYETGRLTQKMAEISKALKEGRDAEVQPSADEIDRLVRFLAQVITDVEGISQGWDELGESKRVALLRLVSEYDCWTLVQAAITGASLDEAEKKP